MNSPHSMDQTEVLRVKLEVLKREHRDLDDAIEALQERAGGRPAHTQTAEKAKAGS